MARCVKYAVPPLTFDKHRSACSTTSNPRAVPDADAFVFVKRARHLASP
jgi:hypothetical protein